MLSHLIVCLVWRVSQWRSLRSCVTVLDSLEESCEQNLAACLWVLSKVLILMLTHIQVLGGQGLCRIFVCQDNNAIHQI